MKIILCRHGLPAFDHARMIEIDGLNHALKDYAESEVIEPPCHDIPVLSMSSRDRIVVSSELPRARTSAILLGFQDVTTCSLLNESQLPHPDVLFCRLPWKLVLPLYRIAWLFGCRRNAPGIKSDKEQASKATTWLVDLAQTHPMVVVFGHGIMHRLIARNLKSSGWRIDATSGSGYWSCRVMSCERQAN